VAGYVDATGFLMTGGYFVSFMSGNSTRLGVGLALGAWETVVAAGLIGSFTAGVMGGAALRRLVRGRAETKILLAVSLALSLSAATLIIGLRELAFLLLAFAMGAENTVFAEAGEVRIGLTYMTGALVRIGKGLVVALFGGERLAWLPYLLLWLGLVFGTALGAIAYSRLGATSLWCAAGAMAVLSALSPWVFPLNQEV
jgi:uncharacterized membrane protein YoaK (UPF0700 family)